MSKTFQVGIFSSDKTIYEGQVVSLVAPSVSGYLGVLAGHSPLVARLSTGKIVLRFTSGTPLEFTSIAGGFLEVRQNQATILL